MKYYFQLQLKRSFRKFIDFGIHPFIGYLLSLILFVGFSILIYQKTDLAPWIMLLLLVWFLGILKQKKRIQYLNLSFRLLTFYKIRIIENLLVFIPFTFVLSIHHDWLPLITGLWLCVLFAYEFKTFSLSTTLYTPFKRGPFEYISGFRKSFFLLLLPSALLGKSIEVDNPNLGLASIFVVFIQGMLYYLNSEDRFYVWIFNKTPGEFLLQKIKDASIAISYLAIPFLGVYVCFFQENLEITVGIFILGYLFQAMVILGKYTAYPRDMSVPQAIVILIAIWFPPLLLVVIPMFYAKAKQNLKSILSC